MRLFMKMPFIERRLPALLQLVLPLLAGFLLARVDGQAAGNPPPSSLKQITRFTSDEGVDFFIDEEHKLISALVVVSDDVDLQNLFIRPTITLSPGATVSPAAGVKEDFLNPVTYTVTAEDGSTVKYSAEVVQFTPTAEAASSKFSGPDHSIPPEKGLTYLVSSSAELLRGTWEMAYYAVLEVRSVQSDEVFTLLEETPTDQTVRVKVNDEEKPPTSASGTFGYSLTFNPDHTYTGKTELGDTSSGVWSVVDLGRGALLRYALKLDGITIIQDGPSFSGVTTWYITGISRTAMHLTRDPLITTRSKSTFNVTLIPAGKKPVTSRYAPAKSGAGPAAMTMSWAWGKGPFRIQVQDSLGGAWTDVATQAERSYTALPGSKSGFYRIVDTGGN